MEGSKKGRHHLRVFKRPILNHQQRFGTWAQKTTCSQRASSAVHEGEAESHQCEPIQPLCMRILTINKVSTEIWLLLLLSKHQIMKNIFTQLVGFGAQAAVWTNPLPLRDEGDPSEVNNSRQQGSFGCTLSWITRSDVEGWRLSLLWQFLSSCSAGPPKCKLGGVLVLHPIRWEVDLFSKWPRNRYHFRWQRHFWVNHTGCHKTWTNSQQK